MATAMTWRELRDFLNDSHFLTEDRLDQHVTIQWGDEDTDEFVPVMDIHRCDENGPADGILDEGHLYLVPLSDDIPADGWLPT